MLTLYHYWSSVCSQKVRFCLCEKDVPWQSRHIDLFKFDHWEPSYVKLNRKAVVPTLDHDGRVLIESNVIIEYLEDAFRGDPLRPDDPFARAEMRLWIYDSEDIAHKNVNTASYNPRHRRRLARFSAAELETLGARHPNPDLGRRFVHRATHGVPAEEEDAAYRNLEDLLDRMEAALAEAPWLAGGAFSLADIAMAPYVNRIEVLERPEMLDEAARPRVADWWRRIQARPAFREAFSFANPDPDDPVKR